MACCFKLRVDCFNLFVIYLSESQGRTDKHGTTGIVACGICLHSIVDMPTTSHSWAQYMDEESLFDLLD